MKGEVSPNRLKKQSIPLTCHLWPPLCATAADLLVCFPARAHHLSLMQKPFCSPARPSEPPTGLHNHHRPRHRRTSSSGIGAGNGHGSPFLWAKTKPDHNSDISEPTSPKVTCAGQIKVSRAKPNQCKNWQSVMEEIERIHNHRKQKKRSAWIESLGFKKEVMQFLTCLRNLRFDFHCFGIFPSAGITLDDEEDDDDDYELRNYRSREEETDRSSNDVFSKWFMILQENQGSEFAGKEETRGKTVTQHLADDDCPLLPPPNALLLMRCRSTPAKKRREEAAEEEEKGEPTLTDYGSDFPQISADIAKETWVVGGIKEALSRSRSWNR